MADHPARGILEKHLADIKKSQKIKERRENLKQETFTLNKQDCLTVWGVACEIAKRLGADESNLLDKASEQLPEIEGEIKKGLLRGFKRQGMKNLASAYLIDEEDIVLVADFDNWISVHHPLLSSDKKDTEPSPEELSEEEKIKRLDPPRKGTSETHRKWVLDYLAIKKIEFKDIDEHRQSGLKEDMKLDFVEASGSYKKLSGETFNKAWRLLRKEFGLT